MVAIDAVIKLGVAVPALAVSDAVEPAMPPISYSVKPWPNNMPVSILIPETATIVLTLLTQALTSNSFEVEMFPDVVTVRVAVEALLT